MIGTGVDPQMAARQADTSDLIRFKQEMDGLKENLSGDTGDKAKKLRQACEKFEAVFISKLWKEMRNTVPKEGYMHAKQEEQYISMFDREFAEKMAASGGIGLADMIYEQLSEKLKSTSRDTLAGGVTVKPLVSEPIALDTGKEAISLSKKAGGMTLEQWGGQTSEAGGDTLVAEAVVGQPLNDVEVKARLETLVRRLEVERLKSALLDTGSAVKEYGRNGDAAPVGQLGREIAKNS